MNRNFIIIVLSGIFLLFHSHVLASSFKATPVRLFVDAKSKTAVLKIINEDAEKLTIQLDAKSWKQDVAGNDIYEETGDIIFFPKIVEIEKGVERIIRIGYKGVPELQEKTYRLFLQELPVTTPGETGMKFVVTLNIPIFVAPKGGKFEWTAEAAGLSEERLSVKVASSGNQHVTVYKIRATGLDGAGKEVFNRTADGWHVLAGVTRMFEVGIPSEECKKARTINVEVEAEKGSDYERSSKKFAVNVGQEMCNPRPVVLKVKPEESVKPEEKVNAEEKVPN